MSKTDMTDATDAKNTEDLTPIRVAVGMPPNPSTHEHTASRRVVLYAEPDGRPTTRSWTDDAGQDHRVTALKPTRYYRIADRGRGSVVRLYVREHYVDGELVETISPADAWPNAYRGETIFKRLDNSSGGQV